MNLAAAKCDRRNEVSVAVRRGVLLKVDLRKGSAQVVPVEAALHRVSSLSSSVR